MNRNERQAITVQKIIDSKINGYIDVATGVGKTYISGLVLKWAFNIIPDLKVTVIVPTNPIKEQWLKFALFLKLENYINVYVINGIIKNNINLNDADLTIMDELHLFPIGKEFSKIFELTNTKYRLGLSGTLGKKHKDALLKLKYPLPLIDTIKIEEAEQNDWCAKTISYNLMIDFTEKEREIYDNINKMFEDNASYFESNLDLIIACNSIYKAKEYARTLYNSNSSMLEKDGQLMNEDEAAKYLNKKAYFAMQYMRQRKDLIHKSLSKISIAAELIEQFIGVFGNKAITFGQSTDSADILMEKLKVHSHIRPIAYHSNMKSINVSEQVLFSHHILEEKEGKTIKMFKDKQVKCAKDRLAPLYISMFDNGDLNVLCSAKALELGFDAKAVLLGVVTSGDSVSEDYKQLKGRSCRKETIIYKGQEINKIACVVNICLRDTKDESWLKSRQYGERGIRRVNSVEEIIKDFGTVLDNQLKCI